MESHAFPSSGGRRGVFPFRLPATGDERLASLIARGDDTAFRDLYERYHQPLYRYCRSLLRNEADAQDALQSTFTAAFAALRQSRRNAPMRPWLFRIAHNESISLLRRRRPEQELSSVPEAGTSSLEDRVEERERLALLVSDLRELPEHQRGALVMRELSGLSHEEIAVALDISPNAAKQTIFAARKSLGELAEGRAMSCDEICRLISDADGRVLRSRRVRAHLRGCRACTTFAAAIPERSSQLQALSPALPGLAAAGIFARVAAGGSGHGAHGAGLVATGAGKAVSTAVLVKSTAVAVVVAATATVGLPAVLKKPPSTGGLSSYPAARTHSPIPGARSLATGSASGASAASAQAAGRSRKVTLAAAARGHGKRAAVAKVVRAGIAGATTTAIASLAPLRSGHGTAGRRGASSHSHSASGGGSAHATGQNSHAASTGVGGSHGAGSSAGRSHRTHSATSTSTSTSSAGVRRVHPSNRPLRSRPLLGSGR